MINYKFQVAGIICCIMFSGLTITAQERWQLTFSDDFERQEFGENWTLDLKAAGNWFIKEGKLTAEWTKDYDNKYLEQVIVCKQPFAGNVRVEFDAVSMSGDEISCFLCANALGPKRGYAMEFGTDTNTVSRLRIKYKNVKDYEGVIEPGKVHHLICQLEGNILTHMVDGKVLSVYLLDAPFRGDDNQLVGFYAGANVQIDNVKVYQQMVSVNTIQNAQNIPLYDVLELTMEHENSYKKPFFDVDVDVNFISPSGKIYKINGFYYGSLEKPGIEITKSRDEMGRDLRKVSYQYSEQNIWKVRFSPPETGEWRYTYTFINHEGKSTIGEGSFTCFEPINGNHGFVRPHPTHPYRWIFDDGSPYFPIGLNKCFGDGSGTGSALASMAMEGPYRRLPKGKSGPMYQPGPSNNPQNGDVYFRNYGRAGFNMLRFSQDNCSFKQYENLDEYLEQEGKMTDELLVTARKYGFSIFYGIFGYQKVASGSIDSSETMIKTKRFIKYSVARWGAYVDFWQLLNEQPALFDWSAIMYSYIRSLDPYHHPINSTWEMGLAWNENLENPLWIENREEFTGDYIDAHWYDKENELKSDIAVVRHSVRWKRHNVPVILGEQGNNGGIWDERSALRMRIRTWTAFFNELAFVFWDNSYAKDGNFMNIWLGPQERQYVRVLQYFCYRLDKDIQMRPVEVSSPSSVRGYGLLSARCAGIYLHHFKNHIDPVKDLTIRFDSPLTTEGYWYSPEDARILEVVKIKEGTHTLKVPEFTVDVALLITPDGPPDIDGDGKPNGKDLDNDNDGILDKNDAYPLDPEESVDKDADRIGDNMDADDNGDGIGDDANKNGIPDHEEMDFDGDGFAKGNAIPWDAFPFDPKEWLDTDGDGIGNNSDLDDDGDGWSDNIEKEKGTDPLDKLDFPFIEPDK